MLRLTLLSCVIFGAFSFDVQEMRDELLTDADLVAAREQCFSELSITAEDLAQEIKNITPEKIPDKIACLIKCVQEKTGYVDENKMLVIDRFEKSPFFAKIAEDKKSEVLECLGNVGAIEQCEDVEKSRACMKKDKNITIVRLGIVDLTSSDHRQDIGVSQFIIHPKYRYPSTYHDIALIKLEKTVILNPYTRLACLYLKKKFMGDEITATGWGSTTIDGNSPSKVLLKAQSEIADMSFCNITYLRHISRKVYMGISNMQFCAQSPDEQKDTCQGDSGGPLQVNHAGDDLICMHDIVGITSFGRMCASGPAVYVNVLHYVKWIENEVWLK